MYCTIGNRKAKWVGAAIPKRTTHMRMWFTRQFCICVIFWQRIIASSSFIDSLQCLVCARECRQSTLPGCASISALIIPSAEFIHLFAVAVVRLCYELSLSRTYIHAYCSVDVAFITHWAWILNEFYLLLTSSAVVLLVVLVCSANVDAELKMNLHTYMQEYNMEMVYNNIGVWQFSSAWRWAAWCSSLSPPSLSSLPSLSLHQSNNFHMGIGPLVFAFTHASYAQCNENMNILQWSKFIVITFTNEWQRNRWAPRRTVL